MSQSQIKPTQIIPKRTVRANPGAPLPRDLNPLQRNFTLDVSLTSLDPTADSASGDVGQGTEATPPASQVAAKTLATPSAESALETNDPIPATPYIIGVKEQIVKFMPDGTAKIDLILEVQDIAEAIEYDIRVAKDSGNL